MTRAESSTGAWQQVLDFLAIKSKTRWLATPFISSTSLSISHILNMKAQWIYTECCQPFLLCATTTQSLFNLAVGGEKRHHLYGRAPLFFAFSDQHTPLRLNLYLSTPSWVGLLPFNGVKDRATNVMFNPKNTEVDYNDHTSASVIFVRT